MPTAVPAVHARRSVGRVLRPRSHARLTPFDCGLITLSDATTGQPRTSWIQLFKTGKFWDPRYGTFVIATQDLSEMLENFKTVTPEPPTRLPIDYNHGTSHPSSAEEGKAAGWMTDVQLRADGTQLWALVEWTDSAAEMIVAKEYQFVSPTFAYNHTHSNGEEIGTTLLAAAICNRPVLEGMEPIALSHKEGLQLAEDEAAEEMLSYDEQRRRVQAALTEKFGAGAWDDYGPYGGCYLCDIFDGRVVYRCYTNQNLYQLPYALGPDGRVTFTGEPVEVVTTYTPLTASGEQTMATFKVKDAQGKEFELSEDAARALAKQLTPAAAPAGESVELAKKVTDLTAKVDAQGAEVLALTARNAELVLEGKKTAAQTKVDAAIRAGKIAPVERDVQLELALANDALFEKLLAQRPASVRYNKIVGSPEDGSTTTAVDQVIALAKVEQDKDPKLATTAAMERVFQKNPALYESYKTETAVKV